MDGIDSIIRWQRTCQHLFQGSTRVWSCSNTTMCSMQVPCPREEHVLANLFHCLQAKQNKYILYHCALSATNHDVHVVKKCHISSWSICSLNITLTMSNSKHFGLVSKLWVTVAVVTPWSWSNTCVTVKISEESWLLQLWTGRSMCGKSGKPGFQYKWWWYKNYIKQPFLVAINKRSHRG